GTVGCVADLNLTCPVGLQVKDHGKVISCIDPCTACSKRESGSQPENALPQSILQSRRKVPIRICTVARTGVPAPAPPWHPVSEALQRALPTMTVRRQQPVARIPLFSFHSVFREGREFAFPLTTRAVQSGPTRSAAITHFQTTAATP